MSGRRRRRRRERRRRCGRDPGHPRARGHGCVQLRSFQHRYRQAVAGAVARVPRLLAQHEVPVIAAVNAEYFHILDGLDVQQLGALPLALPLHQVDRITVLQHACRQPGIANRIGGQLSERDLPPVVPVDAPAAKGARITAPVEHAPVVRDPEMRRAGEAHDGAGSERSRSGSSEEQDEQNARKQSKRFSHMSPASGGSTLRPEFIRHPAEFEICPACAAAGDATTIAPAPGSAGAWA